MATWFGNPEDFQKFQKTTTKDSISVSEFKSFINELIREKGGALPDFNDWKQIKKKLDLLDDNSSSKDLDKIVIPSVWKHVTFFDHDDTQYDARLGCAQPALSDVVNFMSQQITNEIDNAILSNMIEDPLSPPITTSWYGTAWAWYNNGYGSNLN